MVQRNNKMYNRPLELYIRRELKQYSPEIALVIEKRRLELSGNGYWDALEAVAISKEIDIAFDFKSNSRGTRKWYPFIKWGQNEQYESLYDYAGDRGYSQIQAYKIVVDRLLHRFHIYGIFRPQS